MRPLFYQIQEQELRVPPVPALPASQACADAERHYFMINFDIGTRFEVTYWFSRS